MTSLERNCPCWVPAPRRDTNNQWDFVRVLIWLIAGNGLKRGDILVLDNARIHHAAEASVPVANMLDLAGVRLCFLPAYSPELNPCELVFSNVKRAMSMGRGPGEMWEEALQRFANITLEQMENYYRHCIMGPLR